MTRFDILVLLFLFMVGSITGWFMELFFNRYIGKMHKWINPGFLQGPYLPIYGFGTVILYILSYLLARVSMGSIFFDIILIFILASLLMSLLELIGGEFFLRCLKMRLWDYRNEKFNYKGLICLRFSLLWGIVSVIYYFLVNPYLVSAVSLFTSHIEFSFVVGMFYGFILIDLFETLHLSTKIAHNLKNSDLIITFKDMRSDIARTFAENRATFFRLPDRKDIKEYLDLLKKKR